MSDSQMEDIRRICLICGCHTNQIIDVFEPRNGPNIVELIRAKFKFQPVIDDKYLCFSCNNWLINWHSLRNLNKDTVESQSDSKSRSRINDSMPNGADRRVSVGSNSNRNQRSAAHSQDEAENHSTHNSQHRTNNKRNGFYFPKRPLLNSFRIAKNKEKLRPCAICGRSILRRKLSSSSMQKSTRSRLQCKRCSRSGSRRRTLRSGQTTSISRNNPPPTSRTSSGWVRCSRRPNNLVDSIDLYANQMPEVDRSIVSRLQRLGTTLMWESEQEDNTRTMTAYGNPKNVPKVKYDSRSAEVDERDDEVLIDFNQVLSEVFPLGHHRNVSQSHEDASRGGRSGNDDLEAEVIVVDEIDLLETIGCQLPQGVTISLVNDQNGRLN